MSRTAHDYFVVLSTVERLPFVAERALVKVQNLKNSVSEDSICASYRADFAVKREQLLVDFLPRERHTAERIAISFDAGFISVENTWRTWHSRDDSVG